MVVWGEGEKQHRWRADNQKVGGRRTREKVDEVKDGRVRRLNSQRVLLTPYCQQQGSWDYLTSTVPKLWVICKRTTRQGWKGRWVYGLDHNGDRGGVRGLKHRMSLAYGPFGGKIRSRAYCLCLGMVLIVWVEQHYVPTRVSPTHPAAEATEATRRKNTNRQRSKLAEASQEGEKGRGKWKVGDKTQGGRSKKTLVKKNCRTK